MIIDLQEMWNLGPRFFQMRLIKMRRVVMKVRMLDLLLVSSCPWRPLPIFLSFDCQPFLNPSQNPQIIDRKGKAQTFNNGISFHNLSA